VATGADGIVARRVPAVTEHTATLGDQPVFWRAAADDPTNPPEVPVLYLHGVPTASDQWVRFLARTGGLAPDLPGFGCSGKRGDGDFTIEGYARFVDDFLALTNVDRVRLVVHDWGAVGLVWAQRNPERVERLAILDAVPLLPGYRWHRVARLWRLRGVGEALMATNNRPALAFGLREARGDRAAMPGEFVEMIWGRWDRGTSRAILRLYRGADAERLAEAGGGLGRIDCPALVVWGERERYLPLRFGRLYAERLANAELAVVAGAGHWPWLEDASVIDKIVRFLAEDPKTVDRPR
jgi:pimeloyl-ACP methyl ester carboxylesterase